MYSRSEVRHACYRAKNGLISEKNKPIIALVESLFKHNHRWDNFTTEWDIVVTKSKEIKIVKPEKDQNFIHKVLLKASLYDEMGKNFDDFDDRETNIVNQVELLLLEKIMSWKNYDKVWGVELDRNTNTLRTTMYNVKPSQLEVTQEMITASMKEADGSAFTGKDENTTVLDMKPMSDVEKKAFEEFLAKRTKAQG